MPFETALLLISASAWKPEVRGAGNGKGEKVRDHHRVLQLSTKVAARCDALGRVRTGEALHATPVHLHPHHSQLN